MSSIRKFFSLEKIGNGIRRLGDLRIRITHATLLEFSLFLLILTLAFTVRLLPLRWGYYISEFDPHYQYRLTKDMVENGFFHWMTWTDTMSWWPWSRDVPHTSFPGLALTAATSYRIFNALGIPIASNISASPVFSDPVYNFVVMFPVIMGVVTVAAMYFLGKDIGGKEVGLFAALFLALNASYIGRTALGFFDDETVGIFGIVMFSLFFLRALDKERSMRGTLIYSTGAGISMGYIFTAWGASRYPAGLAILFVVVLVLLRRYSGRLFVAYSTTFAIAFFIAINVPYLGFRFLIEETNLAVFGIFLLLCIIEISRRIETRRMKGIFVISLIGIGIAAFAAITLLGYAQPLQAKYWSIINPFERLLHPVVSSVQEHRPAAWGSIYYDLGIGLLFIPVGFYFAAQNPTNRNIYLILFGLTSIYFASAMVRLMLILAPALCLIWALALTRVLKPFITLLKETPATFGKKMRIQTHVGREFSAGFLILVLLLMMLTFVFPSTESRAQGVPFPRFLEQAYVPVTIASASLPVKPAETVPDWFDALNWMRANLPQDAVVLSWWDYGYWITTIANKTTLVDNATLNGTQIKEIGKMFMSTETDALKIIDNFNQLGRSQGYTANVSYVVVFSTFDANGNDVGYGEESKWRWMANIAFNGLEEYKQYGNFTLGKDWFDKNNNGQPDQDEGVDNAKGQNTTMYKMLTWGKKQRVTVAPEPTEPQHFKLIYWSQKNRIPVVQAGNIHALVTIWQIKP